MDAPPPFTEVSHAIVSANRKLLPNVSGTPRSATDLARIASLLRRRPQRISPAAAVLDQSHVCNQQARREECESLSRRRDHSGGDFLRSAGIRLRWMPIN